MTAARESTQRLPDGFTARLRPDLLRSDANLLVGGSPLRMVRLSPRAASYFDGGRVVVRDRASVEVVSRLIDGNLADPEPHGLSVEVDQMTVVVPTRDRPEQLDRCLSALAPLNVIVVDDASRDRSAIAKVASRHGATVHILVDNVGPAGARNAGLARVSTPYVAFVDSDVEAASEVLLGAAAHFADDQVALVGPLVQSVSRSTPPRWFERYDCEASSLDLGRVGASVRPGSRVAWLPSACVLGRTDRLRAIGGFDARMRVGEDVDLVWRLVAADNVVRYAPEWVVSHDSRNTLLGWLGRKFVYGTGGAELAARHGRATAPALLNGTTAVAAAAVLMRWRWSPLVAAASVAISAAALQKRIPNDVGSVVPLPVDIATRGLGWALRQESALLLRHWWPLTVMAAAVCPPVRRALATALVVDTVTAGSPLDLESIAGRRLDDLAYGTGLWFGAIRVREFRCLLPTRSSS